MPLKTAVQQKFGCPSKLSSLNSKYTTRSSSENRKYSTPSTHGDTLLDSIKAGINEESYCRRTSRSQEGGGGGMVEAP